MTESIEITQDSRLSAATGYLGPATVVEGNAADQLALVRLEKGGTAYRSWARPALGARAALQPGENVLVISQDMEDFYIIGVLGVPAVSAADASLATKSGARAAVGLVAGQEVVQVHSPRGELVLEYHPETSRTRVNVDNGDLEFVARNGSISFHSAREIRFGARAVSILSRLGARLGVVAADGRVTSAVTVQPGSIMLNSPELAVSAQEGKIRIAEASYAGESLKAEVGYLKTVTRRIETAAETILEKARNVYRTAEELTQLQTGRLRTLVAGAFHLKARRAVLKSQEDFKVDGERIHLG